MLRTHTCGELNINHLNQEVTLCGWVQRSRDFGAMNFVDLRDRYGITQLSFNAEINSELLEKARSCSREFVLQVSGKVVKRSSVNKNIATGAIEIEVHELNILNPSLIPPFTIENETDGGEELRMRYRYLDLRRTPLQENIILRHQLALETRKYLSDQEFLEIETPYLIKSTPEGARDFIVPSRMNQSKFYALPQSPQTFKQLLMVSGFDKYFQIVRCFRDEDLRADRQPEFTQIDCEMSFIEQEDILNTFEGLTKHLFQTTLEIKLPSFERMTFEQAMTLYGSDKPDLRFDMKIVNITNLVKNKDFKIFNEAESIQAICVKNAATLSRKEIDSITDFVKSEKVGAQGLVFLKMNEDGSYKSSVDKFYDQQDFSQWTAQAQAKNGDLLLVLSGKTEKVQKQLGTLRLEMAQRLGLIENNTFKPLWVLDFPLLEWDEETDRFYAMHHPFTAPKSEDEHLMSGDLSEIGKIRANAYDLVINGVEIGGGSLRIYNKSLQKKMFELLNFTEEEAQEQFGFLMEAFEYGAPPHGGMAFGFDRLCALMSGLNSIRDVIPFPKNNMGRDMMIDAPSEINPEVLKELGL